MSARIAAVTAASRWSLRALAIGCALLASASAAAAQTASGSIGVSLTVLEPAATQEIRLVGFSTDRSGQTAVHTSGSVTGLASPLAVTNASSATPDRAPQVHRGPIVAGHRVAPSAFRSAPSNGQPRIRYLTVAGT